MKTNCFACESQATCSSELTGLPVCDHHRALEAESMLKALDWKLTPRFSGVREQKRTVLGRYL